MVYRLNSASILDYLARHKLCHSADRLIRVEKRPGKNLNLHVQLSKSGRRNAAINHLLVKQGPINCQEVPKGDFEDEWRIYQLLASHEELHDLQSLMPEGVHYDPVNAIQVFRYLQSYCDLGEFYADTQQFSATIATALGASLATLHQATFRRQDYRLELDPESSWRPPEGGDDMPDFLGDLEDLSPDIFTRVSADGLDFYKLYNRSQGLSKAIAQLEEDYQACCLIHNDLRFNNVLLHHDWPLWQSQRLPTSAAALNLNEAQGVIRLIDWEQWAWGDPALDVGAIVAEYLRVWLKSLMLSRDIDLEVALRLAAVPLERLQPSLVAFLQAYLAQFPKIFDVFSDFPERVLRFSGLGLIGSIQDRLHYREPFGNLEISMLQVAKSLLCQPRAAMVTIFGCTEFSPSDFASHTVVDTGETALIQSIQDKDDFLSDAPLPYWVQHYSLDDALADLIANIRIEPPLIQHPAYAPLDLTHPGDDKASDQNRKRYSALPDQLKQAYKLRQVRNYLFDIYFSGEQESRSLTRPREKSFQNNTAAGLDIDFLRQIQSANRGRGFSDPSWIVIRLEADRIQVEKDGLRLWVDPSSDLAIDRVSMPQLSKSEMLSFLSVGMAVSLLLPNACLDGDFYVAIGNEGEPSVDQARINIYFHVTSDGAIVLLDVFTTAFNRMACPYSLSVLNDPSLYGRYNAAVLELKADDYIHLRSALQENYAGLRSHLKDPIPLFTQSIAPGIGLAESLQDKEDFGLSRCQILAQSLMESVPTPQSRQRAMQRQFSQLNLDWQRPHLNPGSSAFYPPLDAALIQSA